MPIPDYERIMLPLLKFYGDKQEHSMSEAIEYISQLFRLGEEEKREPLPRGRQPIIDNRTSWARIYLEKAELLESTKKGHFRITNRGLELLKQNPSEISMKYLYDFPIDRTIEQLPEFAEFRAKEEEKRRCRAAPKRKEEEKRRAERRKENALVSEDTKDRLILMAIGVSLIPIAVYLLSSSWGASPQIIGEWTDEIGLILLFVGLFFFLGSLSPGQ